MPQKRERQKHSGRQSPARREGEREGEGAPGRSAADSLGCSISKWREWDRSPASLLQGTACGPSTLSSLPARGPAGGEKGLRLWAGVVTGVWLTGCHTYSSHAVHVLLVP